ncbi:hypothetical protein [Paraclostridium sordellii]|nr:hypothetical protein [Paeniclostridium sordellii]
MKNKKVLVRSIFFGKNKKKYIKSIDYCTAIEYNINIERREEINEKKKIK